MIWIPRQFTLVLSLIALTLSSRASCDCAWEDCEEISQQEEAKADQSPQSWDLNHLSETFGHLIGLELRNQQIELNVDAVIHGLRQELAGQPAPMSENEYTEAMQQIKESHFKEIANHNLALANAFMASNAKKPGVIALSPGKVQYRVVQAGKGQQVTLQAAPLIRYTGHFLDGSLFGDSDASGGPIAVHISQMIPGFRDGVAGMREGEKRRLFIHPDSAYGVTNDIPPNSLLIFDIEVIKADVTGNSQAPSKATAASPPKTDTWDLPLTEHDDDSFSRQPLHLQQKR